MATDPYRAQAVRDLALLDGPMKDSKSDATGIGLLAELRNVLAEAGLSPEDTVRGRTNEFKFEARGEKLKIRYVENDLVFQISLQLKPDSPTEWAADIPLVYDASTGTFVGQDLEPDIGLAPGQYRPRKTAMKVFAEAIEAALQRALEVPPPAGA